MGYDKCAKWYLNTHLEDGLKQFSNITTMK